jgi:UDP-N-acetylmuramoylalanine--D-glutamate ligase
VFRDGHLWINEADVGFQLCKTSEVRLPGWFNLENVLAAGCAAYLCGGTMEAISRVAREFHGVEHRLELVSEVGGVKFYNDSIATNPDSVIAALQVLQGPIVLLLGGSDKGIPFDRMAREMTGRVKTAVTLGVTAGKIEAAIGRECPSVPFERAGSFDGAVERAAAIAAPGDTVLLSPACASFDMFRNYAERGRRFKEVVARLVSRPTP